MIVINTHQVDTSTVLMPIIKSIPLLYWSLSSSRYLYCIDAYHQVDTSPVFNRYQYSTGIDLIIGINTAVVSTWWQSSIQQRYRLDDRHKYSRGIDLMIDTSALFMTIIKSIPLLFLTTIIKSIHLLYWWLSSSRYLCCIYDYHQVDTENRHKYSRGIDLKIGINTVEVSTWW
jgi:hypothetical protein